MKRASRAALVVLLGALLAIAQTGPAAAIGGFGPVQEVLRTACSGQAVRADVVAGPDKRLHGFISYEFGAEGCAQEIWYVERRDGRWIRQRSPYTGKVLAVAADSTGTYLLHLTDIATLRITKRTAGGTFTSGRLIGGFHPAVERDRVTGDVVASGGEWWAVWANPEDGDLFQSKTLGADIAGAASITNTPDTLDVTPSLVLRPEARVSMVWHKQGALGPAGPLGVGTADSGGVWRLRTFELTRPEPDVLNGAPQLAFAGTTTHVVWVRHRVPPTGPASPPQVLTANDRGGRWGSVHTFRTNGTGPRVALSSGKVFEAWTTAAQPSRAFVAEVPTSGGTWTGTTVSPLSQAFHVVVGLAGVGGKATVLIYDGTRVYTRTQV
jgi:hypothetical protein